MSEITDKMNYNLKIKEQSLEITANEAFKKIINIIEEELYKASCEGFEGICFNPMFSDNKKVNKIIANRIRQWAEEKELCCRYIEVLGELGFGYYLEIHLLNKTYTKEVDLKKRSFILSILNF